MVICQYVYIVFMYFTKYWYHSPLVLNIYQEPNNYEDNEIGYDIEKESDIVIYRKSLNHSL